VMKRLVDVAGFEPRGPCFCKANRSKIVNACSGVAYEHSDALLIRTMIPR